MTITQTVEVPVNHRLTVDVPLEIPAGKTDVILIFPGAEPSAASEEREDSHPGESSNAAAWREFRAALDEIGYLPDDGDMPIRSKSTRTLPL